MVKAIIIFLVCDVLFTYCAAWFMSGIKRIQYAQFPYLEEFELEEQAAYLREYMAKKSASKSASPVQDK